MVNIYSGLGFGMRSMSRKPGILSELRLPLSVEVGKVTVSPTFALGSEGGSNCYEVDSTRSLARNPRVPEDSGLECEDGRYMLAGELPVKYRFHLGKEISLSTGLVLSAGRFKSNEYFVGSKFHSERALFELNLRSDYETQLPPTYMFSVYVSAGYMSETTDSYTRETSDGKKVNVPEKSEHVFLMTFGVNVLFRIF